MSLDLSNYDIYVYQGNTFRYNFVYLNSSGVTVDLSNYVANMHIRRSAYHDSLLGQLNENYPTGSFGIGSTGDFSPGAGITGTTGGLILNYDGITGNIYIEIDSQTTKDMPLGRHSYDLQIYDSDGSIMTTVLRGRIEIMSPSGREI